MRIDSQLTKNFIFRGLILIALCSLTSGIQAQESENTQNDRFFNFGIGTSSWGVPLYANIEFPMAEVKNMTISLGGSYQTKKERFDYAFSSARWKHSITGIQCAGNYYVDNLLTLPENFDLYGGLQLDYYIWKTTLKDGPDEFSESYRGSGVGGLGISTLIGGRYHFGESKRTSFNIVLGAGSRFSSGRIGLSVRL